MASRTSPAWETGLTSLGRLIGLLASDLLLVQVLLMARMPVLERVRPGPAFDEAGL